MQLCSWDKGQCPHGELFHAVLGLYKPGLQVLPTMLDSWDCESWDTSELSDIVKSTCNTLGKRGTMLHGAQFLVPRSKVASSGPALN